MTVLYLDTCDFSSSIYKSFSDVYLSDKIYNIGEI